MRVQVALAKVGRVILLFMSGTLRLSQVDIYIYILYLYIFIYPPETNIPPPKKYVWVVDFPAFPSKVGYVRLVSLQGFFDTNPKWWFCHRTSESSVFLVARPPKQLEIHGKMLILTTCTLKNVTKRPTTFTLKMCLFHHLFFFWGGGCFRETPINTNFFSPWESGIWPDRFDIQPALCRGPVP